MPGVGGWGGGQCAQSRAGGGEGQQLLRWVWGVGEVGAGVHHQRPS